MENSGLNEGNPFFTGSFAAVNGILFLSFANVAVFFRFHEYLKTLAIDPHWHGFTIAIFSLAVIVVRLLVAPFITPANARRWIAIGCAAVIAVLLIYDLADDVYGMALLRIVHGAAYAVMITALTSLAVKSIPAGRSAQAFGIISATTLLPYAIVPPLLNSLIHWTGNFHSLLDLATFPMFLVFPLLLFVQRSTGTSDAGVTSPPVKMNLREAWKNVQTPTILIALLLTLLIWTTFTPVFFFLDKYGNEGGIANPGWFFTLSTSMEIGVRLLAGRFLDRFHKPRLLAFSLVWLGLGYIALANLRGETMFYALAVFMGLGWGVAIPVANAQVYDLSPLSFQSLNTNFSMIMAQGGFFLGPLAGGIILHRLGYATLFYTCGAIMLVGIGAIWFLETMIREGMETPRNVETPTAAGRAP